MSKEKSVNVGAEKLKEAVFLLQDRFTDKRVQEYMQAFLDGVEALPKVNVGVSKDLASDNLGELVKQERARAGITQGQLAGLCGVGEKLIRDVENSKPTVQLGKVKHVLDILGYRLGAVTK